MAGKMRWGGKSQGEGELKTSPTFPKLGINPGGSRIRRRKGKSRFHRALALLRIEGGKKYEIGHEARGRGRRENNTERKERIPPSRLCKHSRYGAPRPIRKVEERRSLRNGLEFVNAPR